LIIAIQPGAAVWISSGGLAKTTLQMTSLRGIPKAIDEVLRKMLKQ